MSLNYLDIESSAQLLKYQSKADTNPRIAYAGTGVGLVRKMIPAGQIVKEVGEDAMKVLLRGGTKL